MKKEVRSHLLEHAKTMAGTVREAYGEVPGRVQETLFATRGAKASPEGSRGGSKRIFHEFGAPLGLPWVVILRENGCLFCIGFLSGKTFISPYAFGGAGGRGGLPGVLRICKSSIKSSHALLP